MNRKQEIYRDILSWALPSTRNCLSWSYRIRPFMPLLPKRQRALHDQYLIAEFVHNLYLTILEEEFTDHDIRFLNFGARAFYERGGPSSLHYNLFAYYIQELFKEVPPEQRPLLQWEGPAGDYSWTRPRTGAELGLGS